jgi:hypothetical protein
MALKEWQTAESLHGCTRVEIRWDTDLKKWVIEVGDEDCARIYTTDIEPSIRAEVDGCVGYAYPVRISGSEPEPRPIGQRGQSKV